MSQAQYIHGVKRIVINDHIENDNITGEEYRVVFIELQTETEEIGIRLFTKPGVRIELPNVETRQRR